MSTLKKFVIGLLILILIIPTGAFGYLYFKLNKIYDKNADSTILNETNYKEEKGVTNILLTGTDGRTLNEQSRSDAMMILTVDEKHKSLKLTSLARDTYVNIPGHGMEKLTHAYAYGGINLLVETIEKNFELDIQDYAVVNFFSFMDIIDTIGGVSINVKPKEISEFRKYTEECYYLNKNPNKGPLKFINNSGVHNLNGYQTLAYARIRKNDTAFGRDERQRDILQSITSSLKELPLNKYNDLINTILPYIKTNMKPTQIIHLVTNILSIGNFKINQMEFPISKYSTGGIVGNDGWVIQFDKNKNLEILHNFIFSNIVFTDSN